MLHVLSEAERDGSTCLPVPELAVKAAELLGTPCRPAELLGEMEDEGELVLELDGESVWAYRPETAALEAELARARARGWRARGRLRAPAEPDGDLVPAPEQWAAVRGGVRVPAVDRHRRPGHGQDGDDPARSARRRSAQRASISLVAPTGRAARRMTESTGFDATTIHSALGLGARARARRATS